jgi:hypothetical protein
MLRHTQFSCLLLSVLPQASDGILVLQPVTKEKIMTFIPWIPVVIAVLTAIKDQMED